MPVFVFLALWLVGVPVWAFGSLCGTYDVENTHPEDLRTNLVLKCMHRGDSLFLDGVIDMELIFELDQFAEAPIRYLYLNSTGGKVDNAFRVAEFIRENQITTVLRPGAQCMSACTLLFQAGQQRIAHPSATLMYHSTRFLQQSQETRNFVRQCVRHPTPECDTFIGERRTLLQESTNQLFALYEEYGATDALYNDYQELPEVDEWIDQGNYLKMKNWYMTPDEALAYAIPTEVTCEGEAAWPYFSARCSRDQ
jgi:hypothetical protein